MTASHAGSAPPTTGSVALLFTDIEGSTRLWEHDAPRMSQALAAHDAIARTTVESHRGTVVKMIGDGMHAVFADPLDALDATIDLQRSLAKAGATAGLTLSVRCGVHFGAVERRDDDYFGAPVNRAARIMSAAHGGQVLVSGAVAEAVRAMLPAPVALRDLGTVRLKDLATPEHVFQLVHPELRSEFPALRSLEAVPNNLPQQPTSFVGRAGVIRDLARLLARSRLLTLTGSGGCGKTRLALQLAADVLEQYPDGAWLVELAALTEPLLVAQATATTLGLKEEAGKALLQTVAAHLADQRALIVLDNCEHLLVASATLVDMLLRRCPGVRVVVTSREALGVAGEQSFRVPSLSVPEPGCAATTDALASFEAIQLFVDRATLARPEFALTDANALAVASICSRLDGIPLAIELAAARVRALSVREIDVKLNERFRLLTGGSRTALPRQQTLRSLIDWSYDLLSEPARRMLQRVSVFAGGWTLEAAEAICAGEGIGTGDVLDLVTSLVEKSLATLDPRAGGSRYRLVETVRQYAREKLLDSAGGEPVRCRHRDYFLALVEASEFALIGPDQAAWLRRLEDEHDNVRGALEWSFAAGGDSALRLCGALQRFWIMHGHHSEGRRWCARALGDVPADAPARAVAKVRNCAGLLAYHQGDCDEARASLEAALSLWRDIGERGGMAVSLNNLGMLALDRNDLEGARSMHEESLAIARELGNRNGMARSLGNLGMVACAQRDYASARLLFEECRTIMRELGDRDGLAAALHSLGAVAYERGDLAVAVAHYVESLAILRELGHRVRIIYSLEELASVAAAVGNPAQAARLWGAGERLREEIGAPAPNDAGYAERVAAARATLADERSFTQAWTAGRALTLEQAIDEASNSWPEAKAPAPTARHAG
jgi:predicted ATPase/class 3 adenylate cyclase